jgi:hypothetical protein
MIRSGAVAHQHAYTSRPVSIQKMSLAVRLSPGPKRSGIAKEADHAFLASHSADARVVAPTWLGRRRADCNGVTFSCVSLLSNPQCVQFGLEDAPIDYFGRSEVHLS